jgi:hypothetical protein
MNTKTIVNGNLRKCPFEEWAKVFQYGRISRIDIWGGQYFYCSSVFQGSSVTDEVYTWFKEHEWIPYIFESKNEKTAAIYPMVKPRVPPKFVYHATPTKNIKRILERGLFARRNAPASTTTAMFADRHIYASLTLDAAEKWSTNPKLLRKDSRTSRWSVISIDLKSAQLEVFRDPMSEAGYIISSEHVLPEFLAIERKPAIRTK